MILELLFHDNFYFRDACCIQEYLCVCFFFFFCGIQNTSNTISLHICAIQCSTESMIFSTGDRRQVGFFLLGGGGGGRVWSEIIPAVQLK